MTNAYTVDKVYDMTRTQTRAAVPIVTDTGYSIGYADLNVGGYTPTTYTYDTYEGARAAARLWNERAGLTPQEAAEIVASTMSMLTPGDVRGAV